nr:hypothetical protein [Tanacetum cinerariifolium]
MSWYNHPGCWCCGGPFNGGNCPNCSSVGSGNEFVYDPNPYSYNETPNFYNQPLQHQYEMNSCEFCGNDAHYGVAEYINTMIWNRPAFYHNDEDDDEEYTISITPVLPTVEPDNSLSMGDEHLSTIPEKEASSVENFVPIPSESEGIFDSMCDVPFCENSHHLDALKDQSEIFFDPNDYFGLSDDDPLYSEDINYVDASPPDSELVSLKEVKDYDPENGEIDTNILLTIKDNILRKKLLNINLLISKIEALNDNPTPNTDSVLKSPSSFPNSFLEETDTFDNSLPESKIFYFHLEEKRSGNPTSHSDLSLPDYEAFFCDSEPDSRDFTMDVVEDIFDNPTREPRVHVPNVLPTYPTLYFDSNFTSSDDSLIFDLIVSFPSETRNRIFDPEIFHEVQSKRFLSPNEFSFSLFHDPFSLLFDTFLPFLLKIKARITLDFKDSCSWFCPSFTRASHPQLHLGNPIS